MTTEPTIDLTDSNPVPGFQQAMDASSAADADRAKEPEVIEEYDDTVDVSLTDQDIISLAKELGGKHKSIAEVDKAKKLAMADFKGQLDTLHAEASDLASKINSGVKPEPVRVRKERIIALGTMRYVRVDNGTVIDERPLTLQERQPTLPGVNPNPMANASPGAKERAEGLDLGAPEKNIPGTDSVTNLADEADDEDESPNAKG